MKNSLWFLLILVGVSCSDDQEKYEYRIDFNSAQKHDWVSEIKIDSVVRLESTEESYFLEGQKTIVYEDHILFLDPRREHSVTCFSLKGDFELKLKASGNGPEEFSYITSFFVREDTIWVLDRYDLIGYSFSGTFLQRKKLYDHTTLDYYTNTSDIAYWGDSELVWVGSFGKKEQDVTKTPALLITKKGQVESAHIKLPRALFGGQRLFPAEDGGYLIAPPAGSTEIMELDPEPKLKYQINFGSFSMADDLIKKSKHESELIYEAGKPENKAIGILPNLVETRDYMYFEFLSRGKLNMALYNKAESNFQYHPQTTLNTLKPTRIISQIDGQFVGIIHAEAMVELQQEIEKGRIELSKSEEEYIMSFQIEAYDNPLLIFFSI